MLLSAVSVLVVAQSSSEVPEGLVNNPVYKTLRCVIPVVCVTKWEVGAYSRTTQLIRRKDVLFYYENYMFRPTLAIIRFLPI